MNPELDRRLTELADAAARATTGIDPAATLAVFRRRRRTRAAGSAVAVTLAVVGLTLGVTRLLPGDTTTRPADDVPWPTADATAPLGACGSVAVAANMPVIDSAVWPEMSPVDLTVPRGGRPELTITVTNTMGSDYELAPIRSVYVMVVRDGVVVGFTWPASDDVVSVPDSGSRVISDFGPVVVCEPGELVPSGPSEGRTPLPAGTYTTYAATGDRATSPDAESAFDLITTEGTLTVREALGPDQTASPSPTTTSPATGALACGLPPNEAFAAITGVPVEAHGPNVSHDMEISLEVDASGLEASRVLSTTSLVAFPGAEPPAGAQPPYTFRVWLLVTGPEGTVVGFTEPWEQPDKELVEGRSTVLERCPDASWAGLREPELFHVHAAIAPVGETPPRHLVLGDSLPLFKPEPVWLDGPRSCGRSFFLDGVTESVGAMAGLWVDIEYANLARDGRLTAHLTIRNTVEIPHSGALTLTELLVEGDTLPYAGSVLTPTEAVLLDEHTTIPAGGELGLDIELELAGCAVDVLPLAPGRYTVSTTVELTTGGEPLGFSSPALSVAVD